MDILIFWNEIEKSQNINKYLVIQFDEQLNEVITAKYFCIWKNINLNSEEMWIEMFKHYKNDYKLAKF